MSKKITPPGRRKHPSKYSAAELRQMLVDDGVKRIPLGGQGVDGVNWMLRAIERIAGLERKGQEDVFAEIKAEIAAETGLPMLAVG